MPTVKQLMKMAFRLGIGNHGKLRKPDLIRAIQQAEGHDPCFERIEGCGQGHCLFHKECQAVLDMPQAG